MNKNELESKLQEACELLHFCLEWDNGGDREYERIVKFLNENEEYWNKKENENENENDVERST